MNTAPTADQCRQCGQTDDHPKVHLGDAFTGGEIRTTHLDCLSHADEQALRENGHGAAIDAAKAGTHGDDLRELILSTTTEES